MEPATKRPQMDLRRCASLIRTMLRLRTSEPIIVRVRTGEKETSLVQLTEYDVVPIDEPRN